MICWICATAQLRHGKFLTNSIRVISQHSTLAHFLFLLFYCYRDDEGKTFVIKDVTRFEAEVIPTYYKHRNFSSFVRQLHIYGFRKIKTDGLRIADGKKPEAKYCKFGHDCFQQGNIALLARMGKSKNGDGRMTESIDKETIDELRGEIKDLTNSLTKVMGEVTTLKSLVSRLIDNTHCENSVTRPFPARKKRKQMDDPVPFSVLSARSKTSRNESVQTIKTFKDDKVTSLKAEENEVPIKVVSDGYLSCKDGYNSDYKLNEICNAESDKDDIVYPSPPLPQRSSFSSMASGSLSLGSLALDHELLKEMFKFDMDENSGDVFIPSDAVELPTSSLLG